MSETDEDFREKIERSSIGTPEAQALRATVSDEKARDLVAEADRRSNTEPSDAQVAWQWCYVEKWVNGSGVYDRVTFDSAVRAWGYLGDNAQRVHDLNQEFDAEDQIVASIEKRGTYEPGEWVPVQEEAS